MSEQLSTETQVKIPKTERPTVYDIQKNAEAGLIKRAMTRYFFTRNYERSLARHEHLGSKIIGKAVMGITRPVVSKPGEVSNYTYHLDTKRPHLDSVTNFATRGSVINEAIHTSGAVLAAAGMTPSLLENGLSLGSEIGIGAIALNLGMVALQRYNRARALKVMNRSLQNGDNFSPNQENWLGIDDRAMTNFRESRGFGPIDPGEVQNIQGFSEMITNLAAQKTEAA